MQPGERVGDYTIVSEIGEGGMSVVYLAQHAGTGRQVVVKQLKDEYRYNQQLVERFRREATILRDLRHPHLARLFDVLEQHGKQYIIQEHLAGGSLADLIRQQSPYSEAEAIRWCCDALRAMNYAHENGIVHRDLKPSNLMLDASRKIRVIDFGIARAFGEERITRTSDASIGTLEYMSPEQIVTPHLIDHLTDVYSMGVVLYELLTGAVPFDGQTPFAVQEKIIRRPPPPLKQLGPCVTPITPGARTVDPELTRIVLRAVEKDASRRFGGCPEFALALERNLARRTGKAPGAPPWWRAAAVAALFVLLAMAAMWALSVLPWESESQASGTGQIDTPPQTAPDVTGDAARLAQRQDEAARIAATREAARQKEEVDARARQQAARLKDEADARAREQEAARLKALQEEAGARAQQQEAARLRAEADTLARQQEAARLQEDADARARQLLAAKQKEQADAARQQEATRLKAEAEARARQQEATRLKAEADALARQQEAARLKAEADVLARQQQQAAKLEIEARGRQAADRFFASLQGKWVYERDERTEEFRTRTQDSLEIGLRCSGMLTRAVTTYRKTFAGWDRVGTDSKQYTFTCDGSGRVTGNVTSQISPQGDALLLGNTRFTRVR